MAGAVALAGVALTSVINQGAEFEQTLVGAASRFPVAIDQGTEAFRELEKVARDVGATTEFTATQAAGGLNFLAKAGFDASQSIALLPGLVDLATASELDLARASDIASDAIGAFGLNTKDAGQLSINFARVSDVMSKATNSANLNMEELFETIKKGAPSATTAGVSLETFVALSEQLASAGLKGSDAGTALKNVFLKLADTNVQKKIQSLGVSVKDSRGELRDFGDIITDLNRSLSDKSGLDKAGIINALFGLRGVTAVSTVLSQGVESFEAYRNTLDGAKGSTAELAKRLRDTRQGEINTMKSAIESLTLTFSAANDEGISGLIVGITDLTRVVDRFIQTSPGFAKWVGILVAVAAAALVIGVVFAGIAAAVSFVAASTTALIAVVVGAAVAFGLWLSQLKPVQDFFDAFFSGIADKIDQLRNLGTTVASFVGFGDDGEDAAQRADVPGATGPQERLAREISETRETRLAELLIRAPAGVAELKGDGGPGIGLKLEPSGAF